MAGKLTLGVSLRTGQHHPRKPCDRSPARRSRRPARTPIPNRRSPRESERAIFRDHGSSEPTNATPRDFLALVAESVTLTIQGVCEQLATDLQHAFADRSATDVRIAALQRLIDDRAVILAAHDGHGVVPRAVLERHGWLTVREARLNVRDAPDWWLESRAPAIEIAADRGAQWLESQGIADDGSVVAR